MNDRIRLCANQRSLMREFYAHPPMRVVFPKKERAAFWEKAKKRIFPLDELEQIRVRCPALHHQVIQHETDGENVQSAVFSECAYAQTLANLFCLPLFRNCLTDGEACIPSDVLRILQSYALHPRYAYLSTNGQRMLIQAGGNAGVDSALITVMDMTAYTIEFKEPAAKASEVDLPLYGEDGRISKAQRQAFHCEYSQFTRMLQDYPSLNFFQEAGHNLNVFSEESVKTAISDNYTAKKFADVVCTEDRHGMLVMLPINQIALWARLQGEIRPAGRNTRAVWTPNALRQILARQGAQLIGNQVTLRKDQLYGLREARGSKEVSGFKLSPLFFVRKADCQLHEDEITFALSDVLQLKPTITAKMFFRNLTYAKVKDYYSPDLA